MTGVTRGPGVTRVVGVDVARCLALLGMMATHIVPGVVDGHVTVLQRVAGGRSAALFALLAGVSLVLASGRRTPLRDRAWTAYAVAVLVRAALVGALGLLLGQLDSGIAVILASYALLFLVAVPFLRLATRPLVAVTAAWVVLGPVLSHVLRRSLPPFDYAVPSLGSLADPLGLLGELAVTGYYPALTWTPYLLAGIVVGRLDLRRTWTAPALAATGTAVALTGWAVSSWLLARSGVRGALSDTFSGAGRLPDLDATLQHGLYGTTPTGSWWWLAVHAPHTGTPFDLLVTLGSALVVLGASLLAGRVGGRAVRVLFGAGTMTLTLYTLHVLARTEGWWDGDDLATYLGQAAVALAVGAAFVALGWRGPLERAVGGLSGAARRAVGSRS